VKRKKFFFLLRGNRLATVTADGRKGFFRNFKILRVRLYDHLLRYMIGRGAMVFTQGAGLTELYGDIPGARIIPLNALISTNTLISSKEIERKLQEPVRRLVFVGRLVPIKGLFFLLDAFSALIQRRPELELHLVGDGPLKEKLEERASWPDLLGKVSLHGFIPHGERFLGYFDRSHVLVMASYSEGLPRAIVEAMARGVPVVATRVGGIPYFIRNGENGLLYDPDNVSGFCDATLRLIENMDVRNKIIMDGYKSAKELTFEKCGQMMLEYLRR
jgi:glycosyltransferase involved in cell wall biosynthesis